MKNNLKINIVFNSLGQSINVLLTFLIYPLYKKYLGGESFGLIGVFNVVMTCLMLLDIGLTATLSRESAFLKVKDDGLKQLKEVLRNIEFIFLILSIFILLLSFFTRDWIATKWLKYNYLAQSEVSIIIFIMILISCFKWFFSIYKSLIVGLEYQVFINIYTIVFNIIRFVGGFLFVKHISIDPISFFIYQLIVSLFEASLLMKKAYSFLPTNNFFIKPSLKIIRNVFPFAVSSAYVSGLWIVLTQYDKIIFSNILPLTEYGYFTFVVLITNGIGTISSPIITAIRPRFTSLFASNQFEKLKKIYYNATFLVASICFSVGFILIFYPKEILYLWTGDFNAANWIIKYLGWYVFGMIFLKLGTFPYYLQFATGNLKEQVLGSSLLTFFYIIFATITAYKYGIDVTAKLWFFLNFFYMIFWSKAVLKKITFLSFKEWLNKILIPFIKILIFVTVSKIILDPVLKYLMKRNNFFPIMFFLFIFSTTILFLFAPHAYRNIFKRKFYGFK